MNCENLINFLDNFEDAIMVARLTVLYNSVIPLADLVEIISHFRKIYSERMVNKFDNPLYNELAALQVKFVDSKLPLLFIYLF